MLKYSCKIYTCFVVSLFLAIIYTGFVGLLTQRTEQHDQKLTQMPAFAINSLASFELFSKEFDKFVKDNFGGRTDYIHYYALLVYNALHECVSKEVVAGTHDWLFYTAENSLKDMLGASYLSQEQIHQLSLTFQQRYDWLKEKGIEYRVVICPDKHTVYNEYLPAAIRRNLKPSRIHDFLSAAGDSPYIVDLRPVEIASKSIYGDKLYYHKDTHWNSLGAYIGFSHIMKSLGDAYAGKYPILDASSLHTDSPLSRDLTRIARLFGVESDYILPIMKNYRSVQSSLPAQIQDSKSRNFATVNSKGHGTAVIFRDSFTSKMIPYLSETFARVVYCWTYPSGEEFYKIVELEKPDVVIEERVERGFQTLPIPDLELAINKARTLAAKDPATPEDALFQAKRNILASNFPTNNFILSQDIEGNIDKSFCAANRYTISGWAAEPSSEKHVDFIVVKQGDAVIYVSELGNNRTGIALIHGQIAEKRGFDISFPSSFLDAAEDLSVYALSDHSYAPLGKLLPPGDFGCSRLPQ